MIEATRRWFRRNRNSLLVGAGVIGAGYIAGQYVLGRIREASQRMKDDRSAKDNLRGRFERNQDDCTYTVLALLPTIRDEIIGALPVEQITEQLQQERQERLKRIAASEAPSSDYPSAPASIVDDASTASFIHTSQMGMSTLDDPSKPKRSKAQLWQDMKINSIARALSLLYTLSLLTLLTRIQLNLLGRRTYLASVVSMASPATGMQASTISLEDRDDVNSDNAYGNDFETNRMYLTFSWWILHRGAKNVLDRVMLAVKAVFNTVNIREDMSLERLSELIIEVRRKVEGATEQERRHRSWLEYLLPPQSEEVFVINQANNPDSSDSASPEPRSNPLDTQSITPSLRRLLDETADLIESPTFSLVLSHLLDAGFSHLVDVRIASEAFKASIPTEGARVSEILDTKCKLAHILPVFCRQAHAIVFGGEELDAIAGVANPQPSTNEYLVLMDRVHDLEAFAAVIYSSNFEYEAMDSPNIDTAPVQQSIISLTDSQPLEKLDLAKSTSRPMNTAESKSQPIDTLGESAVAIEKSEFESDPAGPDFDSAWSNALGSESMAESSVELVNLPTGETDIDVAEPVSTIPIVPSSTSIVVPPVNAYSELTEQPVSAAKEAALPATVAVESQQSTKPESDTEQEQKPSVSNSSLMTATTPTQQPQTAPSTSISPTSTQNVAHSNQAPEVPASPGPRPLMADPPSIPATSPNTQVKAATGKTLADAQDPNTSEPT